MFDWSKATHEVERLICKDAGFAEMNRDLSSLYSTAAVWRTGSRLSATDKPGQVLSESDRFQL